MEQVPTAILPFLFLSFFGLLWFLVITLLRNLSGMSTGPIEEAFGEVLADSGWGSGKVNGVNANNCLKVLEYENGYVLKMMYIFGNGKLWVPKARIRINTEETKLLFISKRIKVVTWGGHKVKLYGRLADAID